MEINTTRFGNIEVEQEKVIFFPEGIPGFEESKRYIFLPEERVKLPGEKLEIFHWLQSISDPAVAFLVINPYLFFSDYEIDLPDEDVQVLNLQGSEEVAIFAIVTIPGDDTAKITANLLAPIVINTRLKQAKQVILSRSSYSARHLLFSKANPKKSDSD